MLQTGPVKEDEDVRDDDNDEDVEEESDDEFDNSKFDDDGLPLVDPNGTELIPFDPELEYDEADAFFLCCFAGTYREVRGKLQATRIGRDQKTFRPGNGSKVRKTKGRGKGPVDHSFRVNLLVNQSTPARQLSTRTRPEARVIVDQPVICLSARSATDVASLVTSVGIARCQTLGVRLPLATTIFTCLIIMQVCAVCTNWLV